MVPPGTILSTAGSDDSRALHRTAAGDTRARKDRQTRIDPVPKSACRTREKSFLAMCRDLLPHATILPRFGSALAAGLCQSTRFVHCRPAIRSYRGMPMKKNFAALVAVAGLAVATVACSPAAEETAPAEDAMAAEGDAMAAEGDAMAAEGDAMAAEGDAMAAEGEAMAAEGEAMAAEGEAMATETPAAE
jgi:hypothetical protein